MTVFTDETAEERKAKKEQRKELDLAAAERVKATNEMFQTHEGRTFLWWLLEQSGLITFMLSNQVITGMIEANPEAFAGLISEKLNERRNSRNDPRVNGRDDESGDDESRDGHYADLFDSTVQYD